MEAEPRPGTGWASGTPSRYPCLSRREAEALHATRTELARARGDDYRGTVEDLLDASVAGESGSDPETIGPEELDALQAEADETAS